MTNLFQVDAQLDATQINAVTTGHVAPVMAWEDGPNGRRPGSTPWQERNRNTFASRSRVPRTRLAFEYGPK